MHTATQTEADTPLSRQGKTTGTLRTEAADGYSIPVGGPQIYLQPLRPYDRLRTKWNLGTGLELPTARIPVLTESQTAPSTYLRLFGLLADGSPWECRLDFEDIARREGIRLGRDPESCDIVIPDEGISRCHLRISLTEQGVEISDENSTNGTAINNKPFSPYHPHMILQNGDTLTLGDVMLSTEIIRNSL